MALTALKKYDNYVHDMVRCLGARHGAGAFVQIDGTLLREFGFAALMHDIGKVNTPSEILNKPDKLTTEEFEIMKRHVVDGAHILSRTPDMPALRRLSLFEHHLHRT